MPLYFAIHFLTPLHLPRSLFHPAHSLISHHSHHQQSPSSSIPSFLSLSYLHCNRAMGPQFSLCIKIEINFYEHPQKIHMCFYDFLSEQKCQAAQYFFASSESFFCVSVFKWSVSYLILNRQKICFNTCEQILTNKSQTTTSKCAAEIKIHLSCELKCQ